MQFSRFLSLAAVFVSFLCLSAFGQGGFVITTDELQEGMVEQNYSVSLQASEQAMWELEDGDLPDGLELDPYGNIYGEPTQEGEFTFTIKATQQFGNDKEGYTYGDEDTKEFTITIIAPPELEIEDIRLYQGEVGAPYEEWLHADYATAWRITKGSLPPGLELDGCEYPSCVIRGTPTATGAFTFTIEASNSSGVDSKTFYVTIKPAKAPTIITQSLSNVEEGVSYCQEIEIESIYAIWSIKSGNLPEGLDLDEEHGVICGEARETGDFTFTVKATNSVSSDEKEFTITVGKMLKPTIITKATLPRGEVGAYYEVSLAAASEGANWELAEGSELPEGIELEWRNIHGVPEATGTFTFKIKTSNEAGNDERVFTLVIDPQKKPKILTQSLPSGELGIEYFMYLETEKYNAAWSIEGTLPEGLVFSGERRIIYGIPEETGEFPIMLKAVNTIGADSSVFTLKVFAEQQAPVILTATLPEGKVGEMYIAAIVSASPSVEWSISGNLPKGLRFDSEQGMASIQCYPQTEGSFPITITVTNAKSSDTKTYNLVIRAADYVPEPTKYTVTFNSQGGSAVSPIEVAAGEKIVGSTAPTREGYTFAAWYKDSTYTAAWNFAADSVISDLVLYAKWNANDVEPVISRATFVGIGVQTVGNAIILSNLPQNAKVEVFGLNGKRVGALPATPINGALRITVQAKGVYIVRVGGQAMRVAVK